MGIKSADGIEISCGQEVWQKDLSGNGEIVYIKNKDEVVVDWFDEDFVGVSSADQLFTSFESMVKNTRDQLETRLKYMKMFEERESKTIKVKNEEKNFKEKQWRPTDK